MTVVRILVVIGAAWVFASFVLSPLLGAAIAGRRMTHAERESLTWGGLGVVMALFILASLLIGARP